MNRILQGLLLIILGAALIETGYSKTELQGKYKAPTINHRLFGDELSMVNNERDEYATNLTSLAVKSIISSKGTQESLDAGRKLLGLALHLSPRNRKAVVVNKQLSKGVMPDSVVADYNADVFSKLLLARGQLLEKQEGKANSILARYFIAIAATIDPRNEDAIYESEMRRIDQGDLSWAPMTDATR